MIRASRITATGSPEGGGSHDPQRFMLINADRIFYAGLLGKPRERWLGALVIYVAQSGHLSINVAGEWRHAEAAWVGAYQPHQIRCEADRILAVLIEPETIDPLQLESLCERLSDPDQLAGVAARMRRIGSQAQDRAASVSTAEFDELFFSSQFEPRHLDARIERTLDRLRFAAQEHISALDCASRVRLSLSRFLRLFKDEAGITFRAYRAWRRGRDILYHVNKSVNLAVFALDAGYPDSTYFSHSIRRIWGLRPSAIFSGSQQLHVYGAPR
jgi:AraC-like DNA-binding protein